jgi:four helix bundle protein
MKDYRSLKIWLSSHSLTLVVYRLTKSFPKDELFGLTSQIRRSASSIPANIAEGCGRDGDPELKWFLNIALGSACELDYHIFLAGELGYVDKATAENVGREIMQLRRMLGAFIRKLKA